MALPEPDYRRFFEQAPGLYLILTPDLRILAATDSYLRATFATRAAIIGRPIFEVFPDHPADPEATGIRQVGASLHRVLETKQPDRMPLLKYDIPVPGGGFQAMYWRTENVPVLDARGNVQFIVHHVEDVTHHVKLKKSFERLLSTSAQQQEQLQTLKEAAQFQLLVQNVKDYAIFMLDPDGRVLTWNDGAARLMGFPAAEILGQCVTRFFPAEAVQAGEAERQLRRAAAEGRHADEGWRERKDGRRFWVHAVLTAIRDEDGKLLGYAQVIRDLTEQRQMLRTLGDNERRYRSLFETSSEAILLISASGAIVDANPAATVLFGYSPEEFRRLKRARLVPPGPGLARAIAAFRSRHAYLGQMTFVRKDGRRFEGELTVSASGGDEQTSLMIRDVTERVRAEQAIAQLAGIVTYSADAIYSIDTRDGRVVTWNQSAERLFGYSAAEMIGQPVSRLVPSERGAEYRRLWNRLSRGELVHAYETVRLRKDGTLVDVSISIFPVADAQGRVLNFSAIARDVSETKRMISQLQQSEQKFRRIVDANMLGISVWTLEGRILDANDAWLSLLGYTRAELHAGIRWTSIIPPEYEPLARRFAEDLRTTGSSPPLELELIRKDGQRVSVLLGGSFLDPAQGTGTSFVLDQTEKKRATAALAESEERYRQLVELSPEAILLDRDWRIIYSNPSGARLFGASEPSALIGKPLLDFIHPEDRPGFHERLRQVREEGTVSQLFEDRVLRLDGTIAHVETTASSVLIKGEPTLIAIIRDITERKRVREEIALKSAELKKAEELNRLKDHFLSTVSHEMKTPLSLITGYSELLEDTCAIADPSILAGIKDGSRRLTEHVDSMLDYSALISGTLPLYPTEIDLAEVAQHAEAILTDRMRLKGLKYERELAPDTPTICGDGRRLTQILLELLENAAKFTPPGGHLGLRIAPAGDQVRLDVWDTGPGIPEQDFGRIWEAFSQLAVGDALRAGGLGLGLTIVKQLVELHGGKVAVVSQVGRGTTFTVYLPAAPAVRPTPPPGETPEPRVSG